MRISLQANYLGTANQARKVLPTIGECLAASDTRRSVQYIWNSVFKVTVPTVIGAVTLSCMTGFALGHLSSFKGNIVGLLHVRGGQFRALPDPDGSGARH